MAASVSLRLNRSLNPDGTQKTKPVSILITYYRKGVEVGDLATGQRVIPDKWDGHRVDKRYPRSAKINKYLSDLESTLLNIELDYPGITPEQETAMVRAIIKNQPVTPEKKTVAKALQAFIDQYSKEKDPATVKRYKGLLKKLNAYNPNLTFDELDHNFYDGFKEFLYNCPNPVYSGCGLRHNVFDNSYTVERLDSGIPDLCPIGLFDDVVFKYFINIKTVVAWAEKRGYEVNKAYKEWEIIKREYQPISLTHDELHRIEGLHLAERHLNIARDFLVLECRTGQRISDLRRFDKNDLVNNAWTFTQKKGSRTNAKQVSVPFTGYCAPALLIFQKYNYVIPKISEQKVNKHIKEVCKRAGITQPIYIERWAGNKKVRIPGKKYEFISTHSGRKTAITIMLQYMTPQQVMTITGIRSYKTLKHYDAGSEIETIEAGLRRIEDGTLMRKSV